MPTGSVHDEQGDCSGIDHFFYFNQMLVHGFDIDRRQDQASANATGRANRAEKIGPVEAPVAPRARTAPTPGPDAGERALLADPCFILEPDFDLLAASPFAKGLFC